jgi:predicted nucleic acid-binding protein
VIIVSDSSPLVVLSLVDCLWLLDDLFNEVLIPRKVYEEATIEGKQGAESIARWATGKIAEASSSNLVSDGTITLDAGESEAITLYKDKSADYLLIDERKGRKVAADMGIKITGSLGILVAAKKKGLIQTIKPFIQKLRQTNQRFSEQLLNDILTLAGENEQ